MLFDKLAQIIFHTGGQIIRVLCIEMLLFTAFRISL